MDWREVAKFWEGNAAAWTDLARMGFDVCRDKLNAPAFLELLPEVQGLRGIDLGCGEGYNTRLVAQRGATMTAVDVSETFLKAAQQSEDSEPLGIRYQLASACDLPFADETFDFAIATMSLMDMPDLKESLEEAHRVIKPGGFFQFSICHPCFQTRRLEWVKDESGQKVAMICGDYFKSDGIEIQEWTFTNAPPEVSLRYPKFRVPTFYWTLSQWLNTLVECGFILERFLEPMPSDELAAEFPYLAPMQSVPLFLHVRCRKQDAPSI